MSEDEPCRRKFKYSHAPSTMTTNSEHAHSANTSHTAVLVIISTITSVWNNWFGGAFPSLTWDSSKDANHDPNSGSMKIAA